MPYTLHRMFQFLLQLVAIVGVVYIAFVLLLFLRQGSYVYHPDRDISMTPDVAGLAYEDVPLETTDGETLGAWYVPAPDAQLVAIYCHGNGGDIADRIPGIRALHELGLAVLIFDYRGYGTSTGTPDEAGTYADGEAAWQYLRERDYEPKQIVVLGESLGGAIAAWLAEQHDPAALGLESTFTSVPAMARDMFPWAPLKGPLCRFRYDTLARLPAVTCPVLIAHSPEDTLVRFTHGQALFAAANEPKRFVELNGGHNGGGLTTNPHYVEALREFLSELGDFTAEDAEDSKKDSPQSH